MVLHGILSDSYAARVFCGQRVKCPSVVPMGRFVQPGAECRMVTARSPVSTQPAPLRDGHPGLRLIWPHEGMAQDIASQPPFIYTLPSWLFFICLSPTLMLKKKCYVYLKIFSSYVKMCYIFFWIHIKIHNYQSKKKMLIAITMNIIFTQMPGRTGRQTTGMMRVEHSVLWQKGENPASTGRDAPCSCLQAAVLILLMGTGTGEMLGAPLSTFSHTIPTTKRNTSWDLRELR